MESKDLMNAVISLAKRRGFVFPGSEIYGGFANSWDYGPNGIELKNNIKQYWWKKFVHGRDDMVGIDTSLIMNPKVWEASGHLKTFSDLLSECKSCHTRVRVDQYLSLADMEKFSKEMEGAKREEAIDESENEKKRKVIYGKMAEILNENVKCPECGKRDWTEAKSFNLMMGVYVGTSRDEANLTYLRPETAQGMFADFKNVLDTGRKQIPFGIAQIGKAFRNEITPGNFIFRTREFEQMEIEYFINPNGTEGWEEYFEHWRKEMISWIKEVGIDTDKIHEVKIPESDRAFYSKRTIDIEFDYPFGQKELYGLAYRTDYDLKRHMEYSGTNLSYKDPKSGEEYIPHVIEPTWGVDRTVLAILLSSYREDGDRVYLDLKPRIAPFKAAIFPLLANKEELKTKARGIYEKLRKHFSVAWDDRGNIGKRYYSQDELGTPCCVTVDFESLEKNDVTVRERNTGEQKRIPIEKLKDYIESILGD